MANKGHQLEQNVQILVYLKLDVGVLAGVTQKEIGEQDVFPALQVKIAV